MTSLAEKEALKGKVQMIYMDPPYGIKFGSNWQVSTRKREVKDGKEEDLTASQSRSKPFAIPGNWAFTPTWLTCGDRLIVARELLTESGSVLLQINSENSHIITVCWMKYLAVRTLLRTLFFERRVYVRCKISRKMHDHILFICQG
jgi:adenine-specific DNA-methyltransferase